MSTDARSMRTGFAVPLADSAGSASSSSDCGWRPTRRSRRPPATPRPMTRPRSRSARSSSPTTPTSTTPTAKDAAGNRLQPEFVQRRPRLHQRHRQHLAPRRVPDHAGRHPRPRSPGTSLDGSITYRLKYAYAQINLDDWLPKGTLGAVRHAADALHRQRRRHLPLPLPGHDLPRARRLHVLGRHRRDVPHDLPATTTATSTSASTTARATRSPR